MMRTESFLYEMLHIREGVLNFVKGQIFFDDIISCLACEWLYVIAQCTQHAYLVHFIAFVA